MTRPSLLIIFRNPESVDAQPVVRLRAWRVVWNAASGYHIVTATEHGSIRITSAVKEMKFGTGLATTASGRGYQFMGPPSLSEVLTEVAQLVAERAGLDRCVDVSRIWWQAMVCAPEIQPDMDLGDLPPPQVIE